MNKKNAILYYEKILSNYTLLMKAILRMRRGEMYLTNCT